ncbi:Glycoside hydrolase family 47 [Penicillium maclennaniae]|uniref:Glycoside hydrolase family 47 n=1 Tax=Penicillium maclennaniae TaxID=1343394 RepID=UPI00254135FC|nr:Glycoside hydrolase family 47 [Penicillium maclennaniae]KAJ5662403.1 Glycoside hydrolase family 47 [Penicillium maclennaniae]
MFRARRYRILLVFAAAFVLTFLHFSRSRDWNYTVIEDPAKTPSPGSGHPNTRPETRPLPVPAEESKQLPPRAQSRLQLSSKQLEAGSKSNAAEKVSSKINSDDSIKASVDKQSPSKPEAGSSSLGSSLFLQVEEIDHGGTGRVSVEHPEKGVSRHWQKFPEKFPVPSGELIKLPKERPKAIPKLQAKFKDESTVEKQQRLQQLSAVKAEFKHAWAGYKKAAMGHDEVKPLTAGIDDPFNGWGATLVDSLDTLWIMDLKDEFSEAVKAIKKIDFTTSAREDIPVFETVIRYLGGLIGAYDISGQKYSELLEKAEELAEILIGAFDTPNRMPVLYYRWTPDHVARPHRASAKAALAEIGSLSLEFTRLAQLTKEDKYYDAIARITNELEQLQDHTNIPGFRDIGTPTRQGNRRKIHASSFTTSATSATTSTTAEPTTATRKPVAVPTDLDSYLRLIQRDGSIDYSQSEPAVYSHSGSHAQDFTTADKCDGGLELPLSQRDNKYGLGALADSTYEYLPKEHLLLGGVNEQYKNMYKKAMDAARKTLLFRPMLKGERDLRFMASTSSLNPETKEPPLPSQMIYEGTHLQCFLGGMLAVGSKAFGIESDMEIAYKLTDACVWAYEATNTGLMPERFRVLPCGKDKSCEWDEARYEKEAQRYSSVLDAEAQARFRTSESAYGQRVKLNEDNKAQDLGAGGTSIPLPMPGSMNPHDEDPLLKRDSFEIGRTAPSPSPLPRTAADSERLDNRDAPQSPRLPQSPALSQAEGNERHDRIPAGMTSILAPEYFLRPEAIESVFIMFRLTGDNYWRVKGWKMFEAVAKNTRSELAHAAVKDVTSQKPTQKDSMESFWLAETLKYFYLLFSDPSVVDLDKYVL